MKVHGFRAEIESSRDFFRGQPVSHHPGAFKLLRLELHPLIGTRMFARGLAPMIGDVSYVSIPWPLRSCPRFVHSM